MEYNVYLLRCPINKQVVYVGTTTKTLKERLYLHLKDRSSRKKALWIDSLVDNGFCPEIVLAEKCNTINDMLCLEHWWINEFMKLNVVLLNKNKNKAKK